MQYYRYLRFYMALYGRYFWIGIGFLVLTNILDVLPPLIIMRGVDQITNKAPLNELGKTAALFAIITFALAIVRFHWRMQFGKFHQNLAKDLRERVFKKLTELGPTFYSKNPIGELMSLVTNDVETIRMGMGPGLLVLTDAFLYFLTIPPIMMALSIPLTFKTLALLPILPFFIHWLGNVIHRRFLEVQERFSELSGITQEGITGIRIIKSYVQEENQVKVFNTASCKWQDHSQTVAWAESFMHPVMEFCVSVGVVVLLYLGSKDVLGGVLTIGGFVAFQRYIIKMVWPMTAVGWGFSLISQARASLERIDEFLNTAPDVQLHAHKLNNSMPTVKIDQVVEPQLNGLIEIKNLNFSYPYSTRLALKDISLNIYPGDTLGIVGPVGSGKTTIAQLLCHLYAVERGKIFINSIDINDISLQTLRRHISLVPQDTFLFSASITENMSFGMEATASVDHLTRVAQIAKLEDEIEALPQRYDTMLGERGVNLSGGQKQRMTITRALLRKSPVIIFDDSLSAVDAETETLILRRLKEETQKHTTIIISHRLSTLSLCNRIMVLKDGAIEGFGTPEELRTTSSTYRELLQLQGYT
ncbi:MAG: ABC transporter ATP-binding protein [Oligoflexia bacterium]|nr:ABC transporter ATP-binding protein [Oligoflexia bacterium]